MFSILCVPRRAGLGGVALCEWSPAPSEQLLRKPVNDLPVHLDTVPHVLARKKLRAQHSTRSATTHGLLIPGLRHGTNAKRRDGAPA